MHANRLDLSDPESNFSNNINLSHKLYLLQKKILIQGLVAGIKRENLIYIYIYIYI
jgi:hypothetical protein